MIIRQLDRVSVDAAAHPDRAGGARGLLDRVRGAAAVLVNQVLVQEVLVSQALVSRQLATR